MRYPGQGCGCRGEEGGRLLPSPSLMTSLSSWGLVGHMAEIHRCFSLLGKGGRVITTCRPQSPTASLAKWLGEWGMMSSPGPGAHITLFPSLCPT